MASTQQSRNVELLSEMYDAFNAGDMEAVLNGMAEDITWMEPEGDPYAGTYHGPNEILEKVFGNIPEDVSSFAVEPERFIDSGEVVVAEGTARVTSKSGEDYDIPFAHVCEVQNGKLQRFTNYTDTVVMRDAFEE